MTKTTKKDFELFKSECQRWEERFELSGWGIDYYHENLDDDHIVAKVNMTLTARSASVTLNTELDNKLQIDIVKTAKHEMIHCLLGVVSELSWSRFVTRDEVVTAEEEVVRKLEKIIKE